MNMRAISMVFLLPLAAGCLTSNVEPPAEWNVEMRGFAEPVRGQRRHGVARLLFVEMRAPYSVREIAVLRADGSVAFDSYNRYAAAPVQLMKGVAVESLAASGLFDAVVTSGSAVDSDIDVEIVVNKLALDCREEGLRRAIAELSVRFVRSHRIVAEATGAGVVDAANGDYSDAFSKAATKAFEDALKRVSDGAF